jgi:hypothetical protein
MNIRLPWEQGANPVIAQDKKLVTFKYFFTRKLTFIRHSDAIVLFPGGFGTMDEGYEAITLMQTGKSQLMPLVLVDKPGGTYWKTWDKNIREHLLRDQLISPDDLNLYRITDSADEAAKIVTRFYRNFHSTRFVKDLFIIRLKHAPTETALEAINEDFADLVIGPPIKEIEPTPEEREDNDCLDLQRIAFGFNRRDYGRLRQLVDVLNSLCPRRRCQNCGTRCSICTRRWWTRSASATSRRWARSHPRTISCNCSRTIRGSRGCSRYRN